MLRILASTIHKECCRLLSGRYLAMLLLLMGAVILGAFTYLNMVVMDIPAVIVDLDNSALSRTAARYIDATREVSIARHAASPEEAAELMRKGEIGCYMVIPSDFSSNIKRGQTAVISLSVDGSNLLTGKTASRAIQKAIGTIGAGVRMTLFKKLGEPRAHALPKANPITVSDNLAFNPAANYAVYLIPGVTFFFLHVYMLIIAASLLMPSERPETKTKLAVAMVTRISFSFLLGIILLYVLFPLTGVFPASSYKVLASSLASLLILDAILAIGVASLFAFSTLFSLQVTIFIGMLSLMFSGITWPLDMFPLPIMLFSHLIPFTPFAQMFRIYLHYDASFSHVSYFYLVHTIQLGIYLGVIVLSRLCYRFYYVRIAR